MKQFRAYLHDGAVFKFNSDKDAFIYFGSMSRLGVQKKESVLQKFRKSAEKYGLKKCDLIILNNKKVKV